MKNSDLQKMYILRDIHYFVKIFVSGGVNVKPNVYINLKTNESKGKVKQDPKLGNMVF